MPKVSIIIPSYNCANFLSEALESALNQTYQNFEIIVVDDGSADGTKKIIEKYLLQEPGKIRYIYQNNQGLACARNAGIRQAKGEFIALLDADDKWLPERLEETVRTIGSSKSVGLVHANITRISEGGAVIGTPKRDLRFLTGSIFDYIFLRKADIACPTVLFRKECCERVGLFDENLTYLGCEDRDLWLRISQCYRVEYIDKVLALYRMSGNSMSRNTGKMMEARLYVINKFCSPGFKKQQLRRKALACVYRNLGDEFLIGRKFLDARKSYLKAISYGPLSFWPWINYFKALLRIEVGNVQ